MNDMRKNEVKFSIATTKPILPVPSRTFKRKMQAYNYASKTPCMFAESCY